MQVPEAAGVHTTASTAPSLSLPARGLSQAEVLRAFDLLRRRLACAEAGNEGVFVGFDMLEMGEVPLDDPGTIDLTATLLEGSPDRQRVRYEATLRPPGLTLPERALAKGVGTTVALTHAD